MEHRALGSSGLQVSSIGLGCNNFGARIDAAQTAAVVDRALAEGITLFDTAESYGGGASEELLGAALGPRRDEALIATKFGMSAPDGLAPGSRANAIRACEASLRRLGTDHIDLFYLHRPDPTTPVAETLDALDDLVHQGKVRYVAASNLAGWQVVDADHRALTRRREPFVANQIHWSVLERDVEREVVPACRHVGVGVVTYFPLASGLLTGKYRRHQEPPAGTRLTGGNPYYASLLSEDNLELVERLVAVAETSGRTLLELALGWLLSQPEVSSVLTGASTPEQVTANVGSAGWRLHADELAAVDEALAPRAPTGS